ncbi:MAG: molybdate ABC transporter substrate-binding protein [Actinomycetes bacterium]
MRRIAALLPAVLALVALLAGCGDSDDSASSGSGSAKSASPTGTINVFAASSLQEAFTTLGRQFEEMHPGTEVVFNFGPSSGLAEQIGSGAPADVFASASTDTMDQVVQDGDAAKVDAGVVYVTDVRAAGGDVKGITIPEDVIASTTYPIASLTGSENKATAQAFVNFVLSEGDRVLADAGFSKP